MARKASIMVRLAPGASPDMVRVSTEEKRAIAECAEGVGMDLSTYVRELGLAASLITVDPGDLDVYQRIKTAANAANMPVGQWLREVCLAAVCFSPMVGHMEAAYKAARRLYADHVAGE